MKGYVALTNEHGVTLINKCLGVLTGFQPVKEYTTRWSWRRWEEVTHVRLVNVPHWYGFEKVLTTKLQTLLKMLNRPDTILLSLICYEELIKLSEGDRRANPVLILNH